MEALTTSRYRSLVTILRNESICVCCGKAPGEFDHIVGLLNSHKGDNDYRLLQAMDRGNIQVLCRPCNVSKRDGFMCNIHNRYVGIWRYLLNLANMESVA